MRERGQAGQRGPGDLWTPSLDGGVDSRQLGAVGRNSTKVRGFSFHLWFLRSPVHMALGIPLTSAYLSFPFLISGKTWNLRQQQKP